ncbi:hypothetical protein MTO96_045901 [Rhipicephalus appendiculatus]
MAALAYFPEAFTFLAAIARQHRGRKEPRRRVRFAASERGSASPRLYRPEKERCGRLCDEVAEEDARPTPLSVELVGVVRPVRPSVFRDWQLFKPLREVGRLLSPCNPAG